jgi:hypothetical protein
MTTGVVFLSLAPFFAWAVHDLQAYAEQYVSRKHAND